MASIVIREIDATTAGTIATSDEVVFVPGFANTNWNVYIYDESGRTPTEATKGSVPYKIDYDFNALRTDDKPYPMYAVNIVDKLIWVCKRQSLNKYFWEQTDAKGLPLEYKAPAPENVPTLCNSKSEFESYFGTKPYQFVEGVNFYAGYGMKKEETGDFASLATTKQTLFARMAYPYSLAGDSAPYTITMGFNPPAVPSGVHQLYKQGDFERSYIYAKELASSGLSVLYYNMGEWEYAGWTNNSGISDPYAQIKKLPSVDYMYKNMITAYDEILDKGEYNVKYITSGAYPTFEFTGGYTSITASSDVGSDSRHTIEFPLSEGNPREYIYATPTFTGDDVNFLPDSVNITAEKTAWQEGDYGTISVDTGATHFTKAGQTPFAPITAAEGYTAYNNGDSPTTAWKAVSDMLGGYKWQAVESTESDYQTIIESADSVRYANAGDNPDEPLTLSNGAFAYNSADTQAWACSTNTIKIDADLSNGEVTTDDVTIASTSDVKSFLPTSDIGDNVAGFVISTNNADVWDSATWSASATHVDTSTSGGGITERMTRTAYSRGDCVAIIDHAYNPTRPLTGAKSVYGQVVQNRIENGEYAAMFTPYSTYTTVYEATSVPANQMMPASYGYLSALAKSIQTYPTWLAVAGVSRGKVPYYVAPNTVERLSVAIADSYQPRDDVSINAITNQKPYGYLIRGNRTLYPNSEGNLTASSFLNTRNMVSDIKKTLYRAASALLFEQDTLSLWVNFNAAVTPLLDKLISGGGIKNYNIVREPTTEKAKVVAKVIITPVYAVEDFDITVIMTDDDVTVE